MSFFGWSRSVTFLSPSAFPSDTTVYGKFSPTLAPTGPSLAPTLTKDPTTRPSKAPSQAPLLSSFGPTVLSAPYAPSVPPTTAVLPTEAPTAAAPSSDYCSCSSCCGCSHVIIPTDVIAIEDFAFYQCGSGTELEAVIITT